MYTSQGQRRFYIQLLTDQTIENMHSGITLLLKRRGGGCIIYRLIELKCGLGYFCSKRFVLGVFVTP